MEHVTVVPAIRKDRYTAGKVNIVIRVFVNRKVAKTLASGIKIDPRHWDDNLREVMKDDPNSRVYNMKIKKEVAKLEAEFTTKELLGVPLTKKRVKQIAEGKDLSRDFYLFCQEWILKKYKKKDTQDTYLSDMNKIKDFSPELSFGDIDFKFLTALKIFLQDVKHNAPNTIWKCFKFINTMIIDAIKMKGIIEVNPFSEFDRGKYTDPEKQGISFNDCLAIEKVMNEAPDNKLKWVAAKFLLMCYSGLRYEDAMRYNPSVHSINGDRLEINTSKHGVQVNMKLHSRLIRVSMVLGDLDLPRATNQEMNRWLKLLAIVAGVTSVPLTCHVGRHTFGEILADNEIPIEQAQKLMGHKKISSTGVYYRVDRKTLDKSMDKLNAI